MKSAEEWSHHVEFDIRTRSGIMRVEFMRVIRQIQVDALREAAELCVNEEEMQPINETEKNTMQACRCAILTKAKELE